jgi:hypothetical protein
MKYETVIPSAAQPGATGVNGIDLDGRESDMSGDGNERREARGTAASPAEPKGDREDRLFQLCDRSERGWSLNRDSEVVHALAAENPDLAEDLYEFFADLVDSEGGIVVPPEALAYAERRVKEWLDSEGHEMMRRVAREACGAASSTPTSPTPPAGSAEPGRTAGGDDEEPGQGYIGYLQECTGLEPGELIKVLEVPPDVYMFVVKDPGGTPPPVKDELAERAALRAKANREKARKCLDQKLPKAAHRKTPYAEKGRKFSEMVRASRTISKKDKQYWLSLAGEE